MTFSWNHRSAVVRSTAFAFLLAAGGLIVATPALAAWDSIAVDDDTSTRGGDAGYGVGTGDTKSDAESEALKQCKKEGNKSCSIEISYKDTCGAYASSKKYAGHGTGKSEAAAKKAALGSCGDDACKIVVSDCVEN